MTTASSAHSNDLSVRRSSDADASSAGRSTAPQPVRSRPGVSVRAASLVAGIALAAMAIISPVGLLVALPAGNTGIAALVVLVVAALDVVVAVALIPVLAPGGVLLARIAAALRIAYAAIFAVAAGSLLAPADEMRFQAIWDAALLLFGVHLVLVGIAALRAHGIPVWVGALVIVAGAGYAVDSVAVILIPSAVIGVGTFTFVGEVVFLVWLIVRGGRDVPESRTTRRDAPISR